MSEEVFLSLFLVKKGDLDFLDVEARKRRNGCLSVKKRGSQSQEKEEGRLEERADTRGTWSSIRSKCLLCPFQSLGLCVWLFLAWPEGLPKSLPPFAPFQVIHIP